MSYSKKQTIVHHNEGAGSTRRENRGRAEQRKYNKVSKKEFSARELKQLNRMMESRIQVLIEEIAETAAAAPKAYRPSKQEQRNMAKYKRNRQDQKYENTIMNDDYDTSDTVLMKQQKLDDKDDDWSDCWNWKHSYEEDDEHGLVPIQM
jgi:hypothetical protein